MGFSRNGGSLSPPLTEMTMSFADQFPQALDRVVDGVFGAGLQGPGHRIVVHDEAGDEVGVPVSRDVLSQPLPAVHEADLRPEIHEAVGNRCSCEADEPTGASVGLHEGFEPGRGVGLEALELVHDHVGERPGPPVVQAPLDDVRHQLFVQKIEGRRAGIDFVISFQALFPSR